MKSLVVSCIVPVFNGERYIAESLQSIQNQTYPHIEIIVADDGSTDRTATVVAASGSSIRYLRQSNSGPAAARNLGLNAAKGDFIAFLDADDLWHPEKLARQIARLDARPELDCSVAHCQNFWSPELAEEAIKFKDHRIAQPLPGYITGTLLARRSAFDRVGPFNAARSHGDSTEWFLRAKDCGLVSELLPDVLLSRRLHPANRSRVLASDSRNDFLELVKASLDRRRQSMKARQ